MKKDKKLKFKNNYHKTPTVFQMEATECGAASLGMIMGYYQNKKSLEQLRIDCGVSRDGSSAKLILRAARSYNLTSKAYSLGLEDLIKGKTPCIIHWNFNHFVVFEGVKNNKFYINDPAEGRRCVSYETLEDSFTGVAMYFEPNENFEKSHEKSHTFDLVFERIKKYKSSLLLLVLIGVLLIIPGIVIPICSQVFTDKVLIENTDSVAVPIVVGISCLIVFKILYSFISDKVVNKLSVKMQLISGEKFISHMFKLPINFFEQRYAGDLTQRIIDNNEINAFVTGQLITAILNQALAVIYFILMMIYSPLLSAIGLLGVILVLLLNSLLSKNISNIAIKSSQDDNKLIGTLYAGLSLINSLKASGAENEYVSKLLGYQVKASENENRIGTISQLLNSVPSAIFQLFDVLVMLFGAIQIINGKMTIGALVAFLELLSAFVMPVTGLVGFFSGIQSLKAKLACVNDINNYPISEYCREDAQKVKIEEKLNGEVELKNIYFGYNRFEPPFICDFTFKLSPGSSVALVGGSGSGKTTVGKLISGLLIPDDGEILFDGIPLHKVPDYIRTISVSTVSQNISIYSGTIRDNITMYNDSVMDRDLVAAAKDACIFDDIVSMPNAFDSYLTEGGGNLSGGQKQRIEIARALITNPSVLILDEATSALDTITEKRIMDALKRRGCTLIIVAHRLSTIRDCDEILVLDHGNIVQRGTHNEMMLQEGPYKELLQMQ